MRVCPKCGTVNKNENVLCANCQEYIGAVQIEEDHDFAKKMVEKAARHVKIRNVVALIIFLAVYIGFAVFFANVCYETYGSLYYWLIQLPWYIPCLILFVFPYNRVYQWYLKKKNKPLRTFDEYWTIAIRVVAVVYLFLLIENMYSGLIGHPKL